MCVHICINIHWAEGVGKSTYNSVLINITECNGAFNEFKIIRSEVR